MVVGVVGGGTVGGASAGRRGSNDGEDGGGAKVEQLGLYAGRVATVLEEGCGRLIATLVKPRLQREAKQREIEEQPVGKTLHASSPLKQVSYGTHHSSYIVVYTVSTINKTFPCAKSKVR